MKKTIAILLCMSILLSMSTISFSAQTDNKEVNKWKGLDLCSEYDDYKFEYIHEENALPFNIGLSVVNDSIVYINKEYISYGEQHISNKLPDVLVEKAVDIGEDKVRIYKSFIPSIDTKALKYEFFIYLKSDIKDIYKILVWKDEETIVNTDLNEIPTQLPMDLNSCYNFSVLSGSKVCYIGKICNNIEIDNKLVLSYDYMMIDESSRYDVSLGDSTADFSGYYTNVIVPQNFVKDALESSISQYPIYESTFVNKGDTIPVTFYSKNDVIYRSAVVSPVWYSQMSATAPGGSWTATNLSTLFYSTSTNLSNSTISTDKPFYTSSGNPDFMDSGCALTCLAMLYRNRGGLVTRRFDYRGVALTNKVTDPFTISLVNTSSTNVSGTTTINGNNYYIVSSSPVSANWATVANYYGNTAYVGTFPTSYTAAQKASYIAGKIDSNDGGVIVYFQSGTNNHYLLFTSYTLLNGVYTFIVCDPGRSTGYNYAVTTLEQTYKTYCRTLDNAVKVRYVG